jgi:16S rRNA (adenine1518-N6/adenine1519-N6)-dimethyltransferase
MKKSRRHDLGQHFLRNPDILNKIAAAVRVAPDEAVLEIGAGKGPLTASLSAAGAKVIAVEKDAAMAVALAVENRPGVVVVPGDILALNWAALMKEHGAPTGPFAVVGNLPYSISSPILYQVLDEQASISRAVFMVQREVAQRITAGPGSKDYAPLGILLQIHFETKILFNVHPGSFVPPPQVESSVIALTKRPQPLFEIADEAGFRKFLHACFSQRRKTISNNLLAAGYTHDAITAALSSLSLDPRIRAEQIEILKWAELCAAFQKSQ